MSQNDPRAREPAPQAYRPPERNPSTRTTLERKGADSEELLPISLVMISLNGAETIGRCIRSSTFVDEVVVLDSGSTDGTPAIARELGARVHDEGWRGFGAQKQRAATLAKNDWILSLDCDEEMSPELVREIRDLFPRLDPQTAYAFPRISKHLGRWIRHGGWYPDYQVRLFHRGHSHWSEVPVHESVQASRTVYLQHPLRHYVFKNLSDQVRTNDRYSGLQAEQLLERGATFSGFRLVFKPVSKFLECYILKRGFLDGWPGFIIAISASYSMFLRWAKIWEAQRVKNDPS